MVQTRLVFDHLQGKGLAPARERLLPHACPHGKDHGSPPKGHAESAAGHLSPCHRTCAIVPVAMNSDEKAQHDNVHRQVELFYRRSRYYTGLQGFREVQRLRRLLSSAPAGQDMGLQVARQNLRDVAEAKIKDLTAAAFASVISMFRS